MENSRSKSQWNSNVGVSKLIKQWFYRGGGSMQKNIKFKGLGVSWYNLLEIHGGQLQKKIVVFNMWVQFFLEKPNRLIMLKH